MVAWLSRDFWLVFRIAVTVAIFSWMMFITIFAVRHATNITLLVQSQLANAEVERDLIIAVQQEIKQSMIEQEEVRTGQFRRVEEHLTRIDGALGSGRSGK